MRRISSETGSLLTVARFEYEGIYISIAYARRAEPPVESAYVV